MDNKRAHLQTGPRAAAQCYSASLDYARGDLDYVRSVVKKIIRAAGLRDELSFTSFRHGGFTEGADWDLTDAELRAAGRHRSARQLPTYAKRTRRQLVSVATKRRAERTKAKSICRNDGPILSE
jgi:hypothetical protein